MQFHESSANGAKTRRLPVQNGREGSLARGAQRGRVQGRRRAEAVKATQSHAQWNRTSAAIVSNASPSARSIFLALAPFSLYHFHPIPFHLAGTLFSPTRGAQLSVRCDEQGSLQARMLASPQLLRPTGEDEQDGAQPLLRDARHEMQR